jgi:hypothetical protein
MRVVTPEDNKGFSPSVILQGIMGPIGGSPLLFIRQCGKRKKRRNTGRGSNAARGCSSPN